MSKAVFLCLLWLGACTPGEFDVLSHPFQGSGSVAELDHGQPFSVIMISDPSDAFVCGNHISRWMEWGRRNPGQFVLVFTRTPTETEQRQLLLFRIRPDGTFRGGAAVPEGTHELLVSARRVVLSHQVQPGVPDSPLLHAVEQGQVAELLRNHRSELTAGS